MDFDIFDILPYIIGPGALLAFGRYVLSRVRASDKKTESVQLGVQALLRDRLIHEYNKALENGYAPIYAKENFNNMWTHYHNLGKNGVMDDVHDKYMLLPTEKKED